MRASVFLPSPVPILDPFFFFQKVKFHDFFDSISPSSLSTSPVNKLLRRKKKQKKIVWKQQQNHLFLFLFFKSYVWGFVSYFSYCSSPYLKVATVKFA